MAGIPLPLARLARGDRIVTTVIESTGTSDSESARR